MKDVIEHSNPWFSVTRRETDGRQWFRVMRPDSAMMIAVDAAGGIVVVEGTRDTTGADVCVEFPCGAVEHGEDPSAAAVRETIEETGCVVSAPKLIGSFVESPGISAAVCHVFTGVIERWHDQELEPGEDWAVRMLSSQELRARVSDGRIRDAGTLAALAMLHAQEPARISRLPSNGRG
ncbi:NUDIX hydrolase [Plantibacter sp. Mn2098]|uniref:NUDIX hydrolase n=1 Tax=Plantibacter sp. Mn2098 TaxID=3395266 RepID=UPI003BE22781